ncbi:hypothetical protein IWX83_000447 [Flavobacterium sp. CG_9.1]|uniref:hypothetical protein n=1 Tax=Flavobacterium sp. CG_9.1 TaxID=2787728 RepID=UPI0018C96E01|nr:hypothetical protein [Flavobacterium sp. CG_9.1]MBG6060682.1 hypothetical protein [Flavobacterium sp. CG_9.1]
MKTLELKQMESLEGGRDLEAAAGNLAMGTLCSVVGAIAGTAVPVLGGILVGVSCGFIFGGGLKAIW